MQLHVLPFLILLLEFWSLTGIDRLFPLLNFFHNFSNFFLKFFVAYFIKPLRIVFVFEIFLRFFIFFRTFSRFSTEVYRFYRDFLVFHFFHLFSAFLFYANAFLLNFIDYFPQSVIADFNWIAAYIFGVCSHLFLQVCCVIIFGIEEVVCFDYFCTLFIILHTLFRFLTQVLFYLTLENCVCFWNIFTFLYFFSYIFPFFWHKSIDFTAIF